MTDDPSDPDRVAHPCGTAEASRSPSRYDAGHAISDSEFPNVSKYLPKSDIYGDL